MRLTRWKDIIRLSLACSGVLLAQSPPPTTTLTAAPALIRVAENYGGTSQYVVVVLNPNHIRLSAFIAITGASVGP